MTTKKKTPGKRGRPPGSKNKKREQSVVVPSKCGKCGSTSREPYAPNPRVRRMTGQINGVEYNQISWKRTKCKKCGQFRIDRIFEMV